ncbi:MAG: FAD-dependent oxidoreductase [Megasphaera sp.]|jgi:pyruvate/2-oxoglutarate dehydrogenase complex dihydrolipoamide dehydrogenase (E3) component|nr:FAD-dependent oxidoreductase [Megasphaera sp.]MCH4187818.1 FAD-dependent oxidoreductase [Megasphaera sp.]MCH4218009.1 FAD-dependent oxidoreductase [Megasphaera sp.]
MEKKYDAVILGFGKGGKTLAGYLANQGKSVALVERSEKMYGGTCINIGCIPTKSLVDGAHRAVAKELTTFEEKAAHYKASVAQKEKLVTMLRNKNFHMLADRPEITIYHGFGSFVDAYTVQVESEQGKELLQADQIFINTGASPVILPIEGVKDNKNVYVSEEILDLTELPKELVIIGGGYIGLEFAAMYNAYGSHVTVLQNLPVLVPREDRDIAAALQQEMERQGITFVFSANVQRVVDKNGQTYVEYDVQDQHYSIAADAVLMATGRKPNTAGLHVEAAGLKLQPNGGIVTDNQRRASDHIWVMGDAAGALMFTYVSLDDFRIVRSSLEGGTYTAEGRNIPYSVFIEPTLSVVGLTEAAAQEQGLDIAVATLPAGAIPKAHVLQHPYGMLKAIVDKKTSMILGAALFCEDSHELINIIKLAMDAHVPYTQLRDQIFTHPTMAEALNDLFSKISK